MLDRWLSQYISYHDRRDLYIYALTLLFAFLVGGAFCLLLDLGGRS